MNSPYIILFDGQCNVCNTFVQFVIRRDPTGKFQFAPLQSEQAARALQAAAFKPTFSEQSARVCVPTSNTPPTPLPLDSIMLICLGKVLLRSDAVLAIARGLRFPWPLLTVFRIVPRPIRDGAYRIFARNRYYWFGQCKISTPTTTSTSNIKSRFL